MRSLNAGASLLLIFCAALNGVAQQTVRRDPSAIQFLSQAAAAAGGSSALSAIQDFTATGTGVHNWGAAPQQGQVMIKALGLTQFRMDTDVSQGTLSLIVSNGSGEYISPNGTKSSISYQNIANMGSVTCPVLKIAAALLSPGTAIMDMGLAQINGVQARQVRIQQTFPSDPTGTFSKLATEDFFFDPTTALLLETQDYLHPDNMASNAPLLHVVDFAQYQTFSGIVVPTSIAEAVNGQQTWKIQMTSISFNSGLTSSDFAF